MGKLFDFFYYSYLEAKHESLRAKGKTVRYEKDWLGRKSKVVEDPVTGSSKTYSYGHGFFGDVTKTKKTRGGRLVEVGESKKHLFSSDRTEYSKRVDGTDVAKTYDNGWFSPDILTKKQQGKCFKCDGSGKLNLSCKSCEGTGLFTLEAKICFTCKGKGSYGKNECRKCKGSGEYKPMLTLSCNRCTGLGEFQVQCKKCKGSGRFSRTSYHHLKK